MEFATLLLNLLAGATGLIDTGALAAGAGRDAYAALTARLEEAHDVETLSLLPRALADAGVRQSILSELIDPAIAGDAAVTTEAEILRAEIARLPEAETIRVGLGRQTLNAGREIIAGLVENAIGRSWARGSGEA